MELVRVAEILQVTDKIVSINIADWWHGDTMNQSVSDHVIDLVIPRYPGYSKIEVNSQSRAGELLIVIGLDEEWMAWQTHHSGEKYKVLIIKWVG